MNLVPTILVALLAIIATPQRSEPDVKGGSDYPLFANRMPGYRISNYKKEGFSSHRFETNPPQTIEGRYIHISYHLDDASEPPGNLAIRRNYQNAAKSAGIDIIPSRFPDSHVIFKGRRNGVEVWVDLYTINPQDYTMTVIERTDMQQVIGADSAIVANPQQSARDIKGSSDYPMFANRMPGYRISNYKKEVFSSHRFDTNPPQTIEGR